VDEGSTHAETASPAEALKAELDKKDAEIKRLARGTGFCADEVGIVEYGDIGDQIKDVKGVKVLAHG